MQNFVVQEKPTELFFTEGTDALKESRLNIAKYSLKAAKERLQKERLVREQHSFDDSRIGKLPEHCCDLRCF